MFRRIYWILISLDGPMKVPVRRCLNLEFYSALIEYENRKAKPAHYLIQIVDCENLNDQQQEWTVHLVIDPTLSRAIEFFIINVRH